MVKETTIGVLALQGDFLEHLQTLKRLGVTTKEILLPKDLEGIDGIIFPGGESTTIANLLDVFAMREPLTEKVKCGLPVWGTCAGMILLAKQLVQDRPTPLGLMNIVVDRNAFGRQIDSFTVPLIIKQTRDKQINATFIRAPLIKKAGPNVTVLAKLDDGTIVAAQEKHMLATAFHPELTRDTSMHEYFLSLVEGRKKS